LFFKKKFYRILGYYQKRKRRRIEDNQNKNVISLWCESSKSIRNSLKFTEEKLENDFDNEVNKKNKIIGNTILKNSQLQISDNQTKNKQSENEKDKKKQNIINDKNELKIDISTDSLEEDDGEIDKQSFESYKNNSLWSKTYARMDYIKHKAKIESKIIKNINMKKKKSGIMQLENIKKLAPLFTNLKNLYIELHKLDQQYIDENANMFLYRLIQNNIREPKVVINDPGKQIENIVNHCSFKECLIENVQEQILHKILSAKTVVSNEITIIHCLQDMYKLLVEITVKLIQENQFAQKDIAVLKLFMFLFVCMKGRVDLKYSDFTGRILANFNSTIDVEDFYDKFCTGNYDDLTQKIVKQKKFCFKKNFNT